MNWHYWSNRAGQLAAAVQTIGGRLTAATSTWIREGAEKQMANDSSNGYVTGGIANLVIALIFPLVVKLIFGSLLYPVVGTILWWIALFVGLIYFGWEGFRQVPVGHQAVQLVFGTRTAKLYKEGWIWNWPKPIGDLVIVDVRNKPLDMPLTEVLTADNVLVGMDTTLQMKISNLSTYLNAKEAETSLKNGAGRDLRAIVKKLQSATIVQEKERIVQTVTGTPGTVGTDLEGLTLKALSDAPEQLGITVLEVQIGHIRLPKEIEDARANVQVEKAQKEAEAIETDTLAELVQRLIDKGVKPQDALVAVQAERGKRTVINIEGSASDAVKEGMLISAGGTLLGGGQGGDQSGGIKVPRKRGNK